jgi:4-alpha-glucanotransferase
MKRKRTSGILLHPTSLPGRFGIGDIGPQAYRFADFLADSGARLWQILPLGPTGYGNSPYSARSSFAGNPLLISCEMLRDQGLLEEQELSEISFESGRTIDFGDVNLLKTPLLVTAAQRFLENKTDAYLQFCEQENYWLDDYALFSAMCEEYGDSRWYEVWDHDIGYREQKALDHWRKRKPHEIEIRKVLQYFFFSQWRDLKEYVNGLGIEIIGDIPIFTASDSADTWANLHLFKTDEQGKFSFVSGVPPDFFSETGQLWGTPVYDWEVHIKSGFSWWMKRMEAALRMTDIVRIDHFRGFSACWEVPAGEKTAEHGTWVEAPGRQLFRTIRERWAEVPIIAEDLGVITEDVEELRDENGLPGMKIFQFAFDYQGPGLLNPENDFLPHNYGTNCVAYTGTHDNDTTTGWFAHLPSGEQDLVRRYLARGDEEVVWSMMRVLMRSTARYVIFPMQDLLELGSECRMNKPSTVGSSNWSWRLLEEEAAKPIAHRFHEMVRLFGRDT